MDLTTQIGGTYRPENHALFKVKQKLRAAGIDVRHPMNDEFMQDDAKRTFVFDPTMWSQREIQMSYYESIAVSDFHIVCNEPKGGIASDTASAMLYAMLKNKPLILLREPLYEPTVDAFSHRLLAAHRSVMHVYDLLEYAEDTLAALLRDIARQNAHYNLSSGDAATIRKRVAAYLQSLVEDGASAASSPNTAP